MRFFTGNPDNRPEAVHPDSHDQREPYLASEELVTAVNLAIFLKLPLLLEGEAGCGKTCLAAAIAYELGYPLYRWNIRSKTRYQEGLYEYDALLRLHDVNLSQKIEGARVEGDRTIDPTDVDTYVEFNALGKAFRQKDSPAVVLIDEIDKADLDFPNDLLTILEKPYEFTVREKRETITAEHPPIVIITSNKEKGNLPAPFLRRCVYHFVEFPAEQLQQIAEIHFQAGGDAMPGVQAQAAPPAELVEVAIDKFLAVRAQKGLSKLPGTSEFLDWLGALSHFGAEPYSAADLQEGPLPYRELLFKLRGDWRNAGFTAAS
ncbi:MAG: MoxR family ATPase [Cyanobacteria bacterium P01_F01_bin.53]